MFVSVSTRLPPKAAASACIFCWPHRVPSGVITHAIRTNTNLWICLRVVTESESLEILGTRDAARIPDGSPGRAIIRLGAAQDLRTFQAARIARPVPDEESPVRVTRLGAGAAMLAPAGRVHARPSSTWSSATSRRRPNQLGIAPATQLWLPPLPKRLPAASVVSADRTTDRLVAVVGLADHPRNHSQVPFAIDLSASGHAMVSGVFGYGKTTTLCQIGSDLAAALLTGRCPHLRHRRRIRKPWTAERAAPRRRRRRCQRSRTGDVA